MRHLRTLLLSLAAAQIVPAAPDYLPLSAGNQWTYRNTTTGATFSIDVSIPFITNGRAYNKVSGYAAGPVSLRRAENGSLYALVDEETGQESLVSSFEHVAGAWHDTTVGGCEQGAQPQPDPVDHNAPTGTVTGALRMLYRNYSCAGSSFAQEIYAPNLGLLQRTIDTPTGPQVWELAHARVGPLTYMAEPNTAFRVALDRSSINRIRGAEVSLRVSMRLSIRNSPPVDLDLASPQPYDIAIRDEGGNVVYRWSETAPTQTASRLRTDREAEFTQEIPLRGRGGEPLPDGTYTVEAWLNTPRREFAGATRFSLWTSSLARRVRLRNGLTARSR